MWLLHAWVCHLNLTFPTVDELSTGGFSPASARGFAWIDPLDRPYPEILSLDVSDNTWPPPLDRLRVWKPPNPLLGTLPFPSSQCLLLLYNMVLIWPPN